MSSAKDTQSDSVQIRRSSDAECAMRILGAVVMNEMMKNGGRPVFGELAFDRKANKCFFKRL